MLNLDVKLAPFLFMDGMLDVLLFVFPAKGIQFCAGFSSLGFSGFAVTCKDEADRSAQESYSKILVMQNAPLFLFWVN